MASYVVQVPAGYSQANYHEEHWNTRQPPSGTQVIIGRGNCVAERLENGEWDLREKKEGEIVVDPLTVQNVPSHVLLALDAIATGQLPTSSQQTPATTVEVVNSVVLNLTQSEANSRTSEADSNTSEAKLKKRRFEQISDLEETDEENDKKKAKTSSDNTSSNASSGQSIQTGEKATIAATSSMSKGSDQPSAATLYPSAKDIRSVVENALQAPKPAFSPDHGSMVTDALQSLKPAFSRHHNRVFVYQTTPEGTFKTAKFQRTAEGEMPVAMSLLTPEEQAEVLRLDAQVDVEQTNQVSSKELKEPAPNGT